MPLRTAVVIGNLDGVHLGHAALVAAARREAGPAGRVVVISFEPHPLTALRPDHAPSRLTTFNQRQQWLFQAGASDVVRLEPVPAVLGLSAEGFLEWLVRDFQPAAIVEGSDFHFGRGREGTIDTLRHYESRFGYRTVIVDPVKAALGDQSLVRVSSSMIRWLLDRGRVQDAWALLGRPYELECPVISGDRRGRTIGFPTANLDHGDRQLPADAIYAGVATLPDGRRFPAAVSVGTKPTFGRSPRTCEAYLIGYSGPVEDYGWTIRLEFLAWLRDQLAYASVEPLLDQLRRDVDRTLAVASALSEDSHAMHGGSR